MTLKTTGHISYAASSFVHHFIAIGIFKLEFESGIARLVIFCPVWSWKLTDDLKNNRASLLYYVKLCASFQIHQWSQTWVTVRKRSIRIKIGGFFLSCVTLEFGGWPWNTIGHLINATLSFVQHFKVIGVFKMELQYGNPQFASKMAFLVPCALENWRMTFKNNRAPLLCCFCVLCIIS